MSVYLFAFVGENRQAQNRRAMLDAFPVWSWTIAGTRRVPACKKKKKKKKKSAACRADSVFVDRSSVIDERVVERVNTSDEQQLVDT